MEKCDSRCISNQSDEAMELARLYKDNKKPNHRIVQINNKNYTMRWDHHTHTIYSHGKGKVIDNVREALSKGLDSIAISDHGPGHLTYGMKRKDFIKLRQDVEAVNTILPDFKVFMSVEANIVNGGKFNNYLDISKEEIEKEFDFIIAGYHYGIPNAHCIANWTSDRFGIGTANKRRLMIQNTDMVIGALYSNPIKILTHPGDKGPFDIQEIAKACENCNTLMEINGKHAHLTTDEIKICSKYDVNFVISSDAHHPKYVGEFEHSLRRALEAGLDVKRIVNIDVV